MIKLIITSEMRVGSRWLHYLLAEILHMKVSPELDVKTLPKSASIIRFRFKDNTIVKFHHATPKDIATAIPINECKIIAVVRNPRDRITSWAFHQRYKPSGQGWPPVKGAKNDNEAVKKAFYSLFRTQGDTNQEKLMVPGFSTKSNSNSNYIWTSYRWLKENCFEEIKTILRWLGVKRKDTEVIRVCLKHSFKRRANRVPGDEVRSNEWFRKGTEGDYNNWFTPQMVSDSEESTKKYWDVIKHEEENS